MFLFEKLAHSEDHGFFTAVFGDFVDAVVNTKASVDDDEYGHQDQGEEILVGVKKTLFYCFFFRGVLASKIVVS